MEYTCEWSYPQMPKESLEFTGTTHTGGYEPLAMDDGTQSHVVPGGEMCIFVTAEPPAQP